MKREGALGDVSRGTLTFHVLRPANLLALRGGRQQDRLPLRDDNRLLVVRRHRAVGGLDSPAIYTTMLDRISAERLQQGKGLPPSTFPPPTLDDDEE